MVKLRWGILSTSNFAKTKIVPAMKQCKLCTIDAISSRVREHAIAIAQDLSIPKAYGSYEDLLADDEIDVIYNPLPNHLHVEWSIKALEAGKHVLCEKPVGLSAQDAQKLIDAAKAHPELKVMEAFMYRHHPQWQKAKELVDNGSVGELKAIQSVFTYHNVDPKNVRNMPGIEGGGGLMDIGCYCISLSRFIFDDEPSRVCGQLEMDDAFKSDRLASAMLDFKQGMASFICATQLLTYQRVNILGTQGRVEIEIPFNAPPDRPCKMWHQTEKGIKEIVFDICDQYTIQGDLFSDAILYNKPVPTPIEDALNNMKVIDAVRQSAENNSWVAV
jgi:predicted dehydrogenase